ncbi:MAG: transglutaminase domain-containing protein [Kofleriaceae bacterium]
MQRGLRVFAWIFGKLIYGGWVALMIAVPLFGFWVASSLAAYRNVSGIYALLIGLACFPLVPVGWELFYEWRRRRRSDETKPTLTRLDRLVLRTLIVNGLFLGILFWRAPHVAFKALVVRGDWMLDGYEGGFVDPLRSGMLGLADKFGKRWHVEVDRFGKSDQPPPTISEDGPIQAKDPNGWPYAEQEDELVAQITPDDETSIDTVARYFSSRITDKRRLAKALHDYVVERLHYDVDTYNKIMGHAESGFASQVPTDVFAAKTGVCEGYARLYEALGKAAGLEVAFVTGWVRNDGRMPRTANDTDEAIQKAYLEGLGHAWNAVKLDGAWVPVDTTWDDPVSPDGAQSYHTTYLFTPPRYFIYDHFPEEPGWQMLARPIGVGEFTRQPGANPYIGVLGASLVSPKRSQITTTDGHVEVRIKNPFHAALAAQTETDACAQTTADSDDEAVFDCRVPSGEQKIHLFGAPGNHDGGRMLNSFGTILVNSR